MTLKNRKDAGKQLAKKLEEYRNTNAIVLALPRGGVEVGYEIAKELSLPFDIVAVRKIGHPTNPEYAIGAVDSKGYTIFNEEELKMIDTFWLSEKIENEKGEALRRLCTYTNGRKPVSISGKNVILVDDGIATGLTIRVALKTIRASKPKSIIVAVPVTPSDVLSTLLQEGVDTIVTIIPPNDYKGAVGSHYKHFEQVSDKEVIRLLQALPVHSYINYSMKPSRILTRLLLKK